MDISPFPVTCPACREPLGFDAWGCLLCGRFFCRRHLTLRDGVATCADCAQERLDRESSSVVTSGDAARLVGLLEQDLVATVGERFVSIAAAEAARVRLFAETLTEFEQRVVDDVQQRMHDEFIDTSWPPCPRHPRHPLWYAAGFWHCPHGGIIAALGELSRLRSPR